MRARHPLPKLWLMTDERQGESLWGALDRLPRGAGIVFRHYGLQPAERRRLFLRVRRVARRRKLVLLLAGSPELARAWGADGTHGPGRGFGLHSASAHNLAQIRRAERDGADLLLVSPLYATRSHPGAKPLGRARFGLLARSARVPVIALGGMDAAKARGSAAIGAYGWAAIDAWSV